LLTAARQRPPIVLQRVQTMIGMKPHIIVMGIPLLIIFIITLQQVLSMSMLIMPVGAIMQVMP
jgi:hypothetical protein